LAPAKKPLVITSWNVNGLRSAHRQGFLDWLHLSKPTFIGLQEVRAEIDQLEPELARPRGWHTGFSSAQKKGYSGVGFYSKFRPDAVDTSLGRPDLDAEGRFQDVRIGPLRIVNAYFPNGNGTVLPDGKRSNDRIPYKLDFYRALFDHLEPAREAGERILVMGDFNTAHREIDLARPKDNRKTSGFTDIEREELDRWLRSGWHDTFRRIHGDIPDAYSWWSQRPGIRARNIGWRLDLVLASDGALPYIEDAFIDKDTLGSDHCPVGVRLAPTVLETAVASPPNPAPPSPKPKRAPR
jgi:exodeoxyribonuclease-3